MRLVMRRLPRYSLGMQCWFQEEEDLWSTVNMCRGLSAATVLQ